MNPGGSSGSIVSLGLGTAAAWGAADFAGGLATRRAVPAFVVAVAHGFSLLLLYLAAVAAHNPSSWSFYGFLSGVFCGGGLIALYAALARGSMGLSAALSGVIAAAFPVVYSWLRDGHPAPHRVAGFAIAAVAIWLVAYMPEHKNSSDMDVAGAPASRSTAEGTEAVAPRPRGLGLAVIAGLSFGAMLILMNLASAQGVLWPLIDLRIASSGVGAMAGVGYWLARRRSGIAEPFTARLNSSLKNFGFVSGDGFSRPEKASESMRASAPAAMPSMKSGLFQQAERPRPDTKQGLFTSLGFPVGKLFLLALVAGVLDTSGNLIYFFASRAGRLDVTAVLASLYPAATMLLAAWVLKEKATRSQMAGMVLALAAVALIAI